MHHLREENRRIRSDRYVPTVTCRPLRADSYIPSSRDDRHVPLHTVTRTCERPWSTLPSSSRLATSSSTLSSFLSTCRRLQAVIGSYMTLHTVTCRHMPSHAITCLHMPSHGVAQLEFLYKHRDPFLHVRPRGAVDGLATRIGRRQTVVDLQAESVGADMPTVTSRDALWNADRDLSLHSAATHACTFNVTRRSMPFHPNAGYRPLHAVTCRDVP